MDKDNKAKSSPQAKGKKEEAPPQQIFECLRSLENECTVLKESLFAETLTNEDKLNLIVKDVLFSKTMSQFISLANVEFVRKCQSHSLYQELEQNLLIYPLSYHDK